MAVRRRQLRWWERPLERLACSRPGGWFYVNVAPRIERPLMQLSRGRFQLSVGQPIVLVRTIGAKSGVERPTPLLYFKRGEDVILIASRAGAPRHPAWYHNLKANPEVTAEIRGRKRRYRAREAEGQEREELWREANDVYVGYDVYQGRTQGRRIPVMVLEPIDGGERVVESSAGAPATRPAP